MMLRRQRPGRRHRRQPHPAPGVAGGERRRARSASWDATAPASRPRSAPSWGTRKPVSGTISAGGTRHHGLAPVRDRAPGRRLSRPRRARCSAISRWPRTSCCRPGRGQTAAVRRGARGAGLPRVPQARALSARAAASSCRAASARWCRLPARLALDPKLLLLDEPTEGPVPGRRALDRRRHRLDPPARARRADRQNRTCTTCPISPTASTSSSAERLSYSGRLADARKDAAVAQDGRGSASGLMRASLT